MICFCLLATMLKAQTPNDLSKATMLPAYNLTISWHKTTLLIFPAPIRSADRGDFYVLAEKMDSASNILKVKAGQRGFEESNLQVVTTDGKVYCFTVNYADQISGQPIDMGKQSPYAPATFEGVGLNSREMEALSARVSGSLPFLHGGAYRKYGLGFRLDGIYIKDNVLFFQFHLSNSTQLSYKALSLRFYIRDRKKAKRTSEQDLELQPLHVSFSGSPESGKGQTIVAAFPKFTIAESKYLQAELMEDGGDRNPHCRLKQRKLLRARPL